MMDPMVIAAAFTQIVIRTFAFQAQRLARVDPKAALVDSRCTARRGSTVTVNAAMMDPMGIVAASMQSAIRTFAFQAQRLARVDPKAALVVSLDTARRVSTATGASATMDPMGIAAAFTQIAIRTFAFQAQRLARVDPKAELVVSLDTARGVSTATEASATMDQTVPHIFYHSSPKDVFAAAF